jgi:GTP-binding protein
VLIESDPFLGRLLTGRIESGKAVPGHGRSRRWTRDGKMMEQGRITKVLAFRGLKRQPVDEGAEAGDIVAIAGMSKATVADTLCALEVTEALPAQPIDPPTISMTVSVNDSPAGRPRGRQGPVARHPRPPAERSRGQRRHPRHRVGRASDAFEVAGRGELQLGVLIERHAPRRLRAVDQRVRAWSIQTGPETGERLEPIEDVVIDVDEEFTGVVIEKLSRPARPS